MADVDLTVNDKDIPLNDIMESMLINIIRGYLKSIKGIPEEIEEININIKP
jgi:hypothetical protein